MQDSTHRLVHWVCTSVQLQHVSCVQITAEYQNNLSYGDCSPVQCFCLSLFHICILALS